MLLRWSCFLTLLSCIKCTIIITTKLSPHMIMNEFPDMPASFGGDIPLDGLRGLLVNGQPSDGCSALKPPPLNTTDIWMVLVARFNCNFEVKVRNAQAAGYGLAIVHNVNSSLLEKMSANDPEGIYIPAVFVSDETGFRLGHEYAYPNEYYIFVDGELPFDINTHLLLPFAIVIAMCFSIMFVFLVIKWIKDRRRARRMRLPSKALKKIPICKFSKGDPYETCAICLDDYVEGEKLRVLPCAHAYHAKCIDPWLTKNRRVCPVCKRRVVAAGERRVPVDSDSDDDTAPLLPAGPPTQGGTFDEQSINPFVRAAAIMARLRARDSQQAPITEEDVPSGNPELPSEQVPSDEDVERLLGRRSRRHRSAESRVLAAQLAAPLVRSAEHPTNRRVTFEASNERNEPTRQTGKRDSRRKGKRSDRGPPEPSRDERGESRGEIGVAAIPASLNPPAGSSRNLDI